MLQVSSPIHDFFNLVLAGVAHFTPDYFKESLGFSKTRLKEGFKFFSCQWHQSLTNYLPLILLPAVQSPVLQESSCQKDSILGRDSHSSKMVYELLTKIVAFHMRFIIIYLQGLGLEWLFSRPQKFRYNWLGIMTVQSCPDNSLEFFISIQPRDKRR